MRVRYFGLAFLVLVVAVPIGVLALLTTSTAERTTVLEVRTGNDRLAGSIADQLADYVRAERQMIASLGETIVQTGETLLQRKIIDAFLIKHRHVKEVAIYGADGSLIIGARELDVGLEAALAGKPTRIAAPEKEGKLAIGHMVLVAEPVTVAGQRRGAILAKIDLVGIWEPVNAVTIGKSGFVRLLTSAGVLLAHGNAEERRVVFNPDEDVSARLVAGALAGTIVRNKQGDEVIATAALVPSIDAIVLVEQPAEEAYAAVSSMRRQLVIIAGATLLLALVGGFVFGGHLVRGIERLRLHTRRLARGNLDEAIDPASIAQISELRGLAGAINEMASDLAESQRQMAERERMDTFARVAAGLAHDLRRPIDDIRGAFLELVEHRDDPTAVDQVISASEGAVPRLTRFMNDLTKLAQTGELELAVERVDALELARGVVATLSASRKFAGMVSFEATGDRAFITGDRELITRALSNLAHNGAEACGPKGPGQTVAINVSTKDDKVLLAVSDTGIGIEPERHREVLSSCFKSTRRSTGVGLGLGVVRQVAESHRGALDLESKPGKGSTFTLALPLERTTERQSGHETEDDSVETGSLHGAGRAIDNDQHGRAESQGHMFPD